MTILTCCTKCKKLLDPSNFYARHKKCKACHKSVARKWALQNPEKQKAKRDEWVQNNKEKFREVCRQSYLRRKERLKKKDVLIFELQEKIKFLEETLKDLQQAM